MNNWYAALNEGQNGLIEDTDNGDVVALVYKKEHTQLLAAAPALLEALKKLNDNRSLLPNDLQQIVVEAIEEAEEYEPI